MEKQTRSILAILSTDIPEYTQKTEEDESHAFSLIAKHRDIINKHVGSSNGFTFKEMGDGTFNKFDSAIDASRCAIKIQNEAVERELPLRVGVHLGDVVQEGDDILGIGVNIADRIQGIAKPGTIYISDDIFRQIKNQPDLNTISIGEHALKGIQGKMTLHELVFNRDGTITERIEVTHKIQVHDEDGNKVEKETPKNEFLKTLTMFFFDNKTENSELDWLQYGIANACYYTLQQEKVIVMNKPYSMSEDFTGYSQKSDKIDSLNIPNTLKKKITNQQNKDYWISGDILNHQNGYCISTELYDAKLGKLLQKREFSGESIFSLIDNIALQLRYDLEIPPSHIESSGDLSIADIYTNNIKAFELYTKSKFEKEKGTKSKKELMELHINSLEEALKHDNEFPEAYLGLGQIHLILGNDDKLKECLEKLMTLLYKLPEPEQYKTKGEYFRFIENNPEKLIKLYELWVKIQPHNITAHKELAGAYYEQRFLDKALEHMLIVLNMNPTDFNAVSHIVDAYKEKNNFKSAETLLKKYIDSFPENYKPYFELGKLYEKMGEFQKAKEQYEIVSLIEPNYNDLTLAKIETKFGEFDLAVNKLKRLYDNPKKTYLKYYILRELADIYKVTGKLKKSIEFSEKAHELEPS
tara:strand:- start:3339 stop:5258 length:1920 start_codon:yes stop_codon:yes gene_type:complete